MPQLLLEPKGTLKEMSMTFVLNNMKPKILSLVSGGSHSVLLRAIQLLLCIMISLNGQVTEENVILRRCAPQFSWFT